MNSLIEKLQKESLLEVVCNLAEADKLKVFLVGGFLRDIILDRKTKNYDFDFALKKGAINFARKISKKIKGNFVLLDREHGCGRVVYNKNNRVYTLDFTDFRGKDLREDLIHRDFSINSLCVELSKIKNSDNLSDVIIDEHNGLRDLKEKRIRIVSKTAFREDPLRIIRAFSLSCLLNFSISKTTVSQIKRDKHKITDVAFERIRDEFFKILDEDESFYYLKMMDDLGIIEILIPEINIMRGVIQGPYHHLDVWQHSLETVKQLESVVRQLRCNQKIQEYLDQIMASDRRRLGLLKLGALLHDIGKPQSLKIEEGRTRFHGHEHIGRQMIKRISQRFKISTKESDALERMVLWHLRPGYLADFKMPTPRAIFRYFRDTGQEGISVLLISLADQRATRGPLTNDKSREHHEKIIMDLIDHYFKSREEKKPPRLITGFDLIRRLRLKPSPLFGKILTKVEEAQAIGKIRTKREALWLARKIARR
jgi:poly(A) polymerase